MPITLKTNSFKFRDDPSDEWSGALVQAVTDLEPAMDRIDEVENGLAIIVNGDTCSTAVPVGGYAYIKNNTHGLADGLYTNTSSSAFPVSGGTADGTVFTDVSGGGLNDLNSFFNTINTATTLSGIYANYLKIGKLVVAHIQQDSQASNIYDIPPINGLNSYKYGICFAMRNINTGVTSMVDAYANSDNSIHINIQYFTAGTWCGAFSYLTD